LSSWVANFAANYQADSPPKHLRERAVLEGKGCRPTCATLEGERNRLSYSRIKGGEASELEAGALNTQLKGTLKRGKRDTRESLGTDHQPKKVGIACPLGRSRGITQKRAGGNRISRKGTVTSAERGPRASSVLQISGVPRLCLDEAGGTLKKFQ